MLSYQLLFLNFIMLKLIYISFDITKRETEFKILLELNLISTN